MSLFDELKRRNVFKVGAAYLVVGWVVIEVAATVAPQLALPEWVPRFITLLILLGFPVAMVLAWILDMTPEGMQVTEGGVGSKRFYTVISVITAALLGWFFHGQPQDAGDSPVSSSADAPPSIAVLPFVDLSAGGDQQYFADGVAEEILNALAQNPHLRVVARTSAFQFRDGADLRSVGVALGVNRIVEGSVRMVDSRVRIVTQLIDSQTGLNIWSNSFDGELTDIIAVQEKIASEIIDAMSDHLGLQQLPTTRAAPASVDAEAYHLYLRGRKALNERFMPGRLAESIELLESAVMRDANMAVAHGTLALARVLSFHYGDERLRDVVKQTLDSAERALELDPANVDGLTAKGYALVLLGTRFAEGEQLLRRALGRRPNDVMANNLMGDIGRFVGDRDVALTYEKRAAELDPLNAVAQNDLANAFSLDRNWSQVLVYSRRADALEPSNLFSPHTEIRALLFTGNPSAARALFERSVAEGRYFPDLEIMDGLALGIVLGDAALVEAYRGRAQTASYSVAIGAAFLTDDYAAAAALIREAFAVDDVEWVWRPGSIAIHTALARDGHAVAIPAKYAELFARMSLSPWKRRNLRSELLSLRDGSGSR